MNYPSDDMFEEARRHREPPSNKHKHLMNDKIFGWSWSLIDQMIVLSQEDPSAWLQHLFWAGPDKHCCVIISHGHVALVVNGQTIYSEPIEHFDGESVSNIEGILNGTRETGTGNPLCPQCGEVQHTDCVCDYAQVHWPF